MRRIRAVDIGGTKIAPASFAMIYSPARGLDTTAAGQMIAVYAKKAIELRNEIIKAARAVHMGEVPVLRIGLKEFVGKNYVHPNHIPVANRISSRSAEEIATDTSGGHRNARRL
jgi:hypothetical protein